MINIGKIKDTIIDGGNVNCRFAYYGLNRLRCSRAGNEGNYCQYWNDRVYFEYCDLKID